MKPRCSNKTIQGLIQSFPITKIGYSTYHEIIAWELRASIRRYFEIWKRALDEKKSAAIPEIYTLAIEQYRLPIVVLSCILLESVINFYLCAKCDSKLFEDLQWAELFDKWKELPKKFNPDYQLQKNSELGKHLRQLITRRNLIVHSKPKMIINDESRHDGNVPSIAFDEHEFIGRCANLPDRLIDHLIQFDPQMFDVLSSIRTHCGLVAREFKIGQNRLKADS